MRGVADAGVESFDENAVVWHFWKRLDVRAFATVVLRVTRRHHCIIASRSCRNTNNEVG